MHSSAKKRAEGRQEKHLSIEIPTEETTAQICQEKATGRRRKPKPKPSARERERERREGTDTGERERGGGGNGENDTRWHGVLWAGGPSNRRPWGWESGAVTFGRYPPELPKNLPLYVYIKIIFKIY